MFSVSQYSASTHFVPALEVRLWRDAKVLKWNTLTCVSVLLAVYKTQ